MDDTKHKILLVEDDKIDQKAFEWLIRKESLPYECTIAASISDVRKIWDSKRFDIVISDMNLGDGTGFDVINMVKDVPIIVVTGAGSEEIAVKAIKAGAYEYLVKDVDRNYLKVIPVTVENALKYKKLEAILSEKQKNILAIFDAVPIWMLLIDEHLIVKRVNEAVKQTVNKEYIQIINRPVGEALCCVNSVNEKGCGFSQFCGLCLFREVITKALSTGQSVKKIEIQPTLRIDNKELSPWLCVSAEPIIIDGSKHVVIAIDDITDRKEAEEKLKETMELKSQFISTVSHELRTPLGCIKEAISIVLDEVAGKISDQQKKFLEMAKRNVDRLAILVNDVLDFQRLESNKVKLDIQENDIKQVVEDAYQTMSPLAKKKMIDFSLDIEGNLPKAKFDGVKIIQVLTNLISNAVKFTPDRGKISVSIQRWDEDLVMRVSDTGMGIPKDALSKIFDRFYRVHRPGKEIQGTGLGLAIVNKIIMLHGGRIEVESEIDKGTTFVVFLPISGMPELDILPQTTDDALEKALVTP